MKPTFRVFDTDDLETAGRIVYRAFSAGFRRYGYSEPIPDTRAGTALAAAVYAADPAGALLMETASGRPLGVAFFQRFPDHAFIGPLAIDPDVQARGHGTRLLEEVLELIGDQSVRLLQDAFNPVSFRLYARAGFAVRESLALLVTGPGGPRPGPFSEPPGDGTRGVWSLREVTVRDAKELSALDRRCGGIDRGDIIERVGARMRGLVLDGPGEPRGFACAFPGTGLWVVGPGWAEDGRTLAALLVGLSQRCVRDRESVALFAPASRADLVAPLFDIGFRTSHLVNLMVKGDYDGVRGVYLPILPLDATTA